MILAGPVQSAVQWQKRSKSKMTAKKAKIHKKAPKECRGRESLKSEKAREPHAPSLKDSTSSTGAHYDRQEGQDPKKVTAPKTEILQKNAETENLQKSVKTPPKGCTSQKGRKPHAPSFKDSTWFNEAHYM